VLLTETHLALVMEYAAGNSLTGYVADKWQHAQHTGLFLGEDEARYFFRVRPRVRSRGWSRRRVVGHCRRGRGPSLVTRERQD